MSLGANETPWCLLLHLFQETSSWWACFWSEGPTRSSVPCVETASPRLLWETWTRSAWQHRTATGDTSNPSALHLPPDLSISAVSIRVRSAPSASHKIPAHTRCLSFPAEQQTMRAAAKLSASRANKLINIHGNGVKRSGTDTVERFYDNQLQSSSWAGCMLADGYRPDSLTRRKKWKLNGVNSAHFNNISKIFN